MNLFLDSNAICLNTFLIAGDEYYLKLSKTVKNIFWKNVLSSLADFMRIIPMDSKDDILNEPLWLNSKIKIGNESIFYKDWSLKGIHIVQDLFNDYGDPLNFECFRNKYGLNIPFTSYFG